MRGDGAVALVRKASILPPETPIVAVEVTDSCIDVQHRIDGSSEHGHACLVAQVRDEVMCALIVEGEPTEFLPPGRWIDETIAPVDTPLARWVDYLILRTRGRDVELVQWLPLPQEPRRKRRGTL